MEKESLEVLITVPLSDELVQELRAISPRLNITHLPVQSAQEIPLDIWKKTEVLYAGKILPDPEWAPELRWVQCHFAGIDFFLNSPLIRSETVRITTLSGAASTQSAEYALTMMLALGRRLPEFFSLQSRSEWAAERWERYNPFELRGSTVGLVGYGSINRQVARLLQPFGAVVLAAKRDARKPGDDGYTPEGEGDPGGNFFTRLYPIQALQSMLKLCDFVVVALPGTHQTTRLIGTPELQVMKPTAFLINLGRGNAIDQAALTDALVQRRIAGAALDVFNSEPLPPDDPLWKLPNVIITPHVAGISAQYDQRAVVMFSVNLQRYLNAEPLLNLFDPKKEY